MRTTLIESRVKSRSRGLVGEAASVLAHVCIVALAVVATRQTGEARASGPLIDPPIYVAPAEQVDAPRPDGERRLVRERSSIPDPLPDVTVQVPHPDIFTGVPDVLPPVDPTGQSFDERVFERSRADGADDSQAGTNDGSGTFTAATVEIEAAPLPGSRPPRYPEILRASSVPGTVLVRFVVDTAGRVEAGSVVALSSSHALFAASVRSAILATRYRPARAANRPVRQLVEQRFDFTLDGGGR